MEASLGSHPIPDTRGGRFYRQILVIAALCAVVGIADALRALFWSGLPMVAGGAPELAPRQLMHTAVQLIGWVLIGWGAWRGVSRKLLPPPWLVLVLPILVWIRLLT